ncbi:hypothetical protein HON52_03935 [Candidatus Uhrbacteria bacterium]|jgi:hypothetical protein|nr:hypothetical protein [Candidatus Uhrbacteria bacterium]
MLNIQTSTKPVRLLYFWIGILAAVAYRAIIVLNFFEPIWVKVAWYVGTIGFIFYFWSRYRVVKQFSKLIHEQKLVSAVKKAGNITTDQKQALSHIIETLRTTKAQLNYEIIFVLSIVALVIGVVLDFL